MGKWNRFRASSAPFVIAVVAGLAALPAVSLAATLSSVDHVTQGAINGNQIENTTFDFVSRDGSRLFFHTEEQLAETDTDGVNDIYMREGSTTTHISQGDTDEGTNSGIPNAAVIGGIPASQDGKRFFMFTNEKMTADDNDSPTAADIFMREGSTITRISRGEDAAHNQPNTTFQADWGGMSADGSRAIFYTSEQLTSEDTDGASDVYMRHGSTIKLISQGPFTDPGGPKNAFPSGFFGTSSTDGLRVFFTTDERLAADDTDSVTDIYMREGSTTTRISKGEGATGNGAFPAPTATSGFVFPSDDGSRVFFASNEQLAPTDTDSLTDIYMREGSTTTQITLGPTGGSGAFPVFPGLALPSRDGARAIFATDEKLTADDTDSVSDLYMREGSTTTRVSQGPTGGNSDSFPAGLNVLFYPEGGRVLFGTEEKLTSADTDNQPDLYMREGSTTTLISQGAPGFGNGAFPIGFGGASEDGSRVFFYTDEHMAATDTDSETDVYVREGSTTTQVTLTAQGGNANIESFPVGNSADGNRFFFRTGEQLLPTDTDPVLDIYAANIGPDGPTGLSTSPASPANDNSPRVKGTTGAGTVSVRIYQTGNCTNAFTTGTTAEFEGSGIQISVPDNSNTLISAQGVNGDGNPSSCSTALAYVEDSAGPAAPTGLSTTPVSPANDNSPRVKGSSSADTVDVRVYKTNNCTGGFTADTKAQFEGTGIQISVGDNTTTPLSARGLDALGNPGTCSTSISYTENSAGPPAPGVPTGLSTNPASPAGDNSPRVKGTAGSNTVDVRVYKTANCTGGFTTDTKAQFEGAGIQISVTDNTTTSISAVGVDGVGTQSPCSAAIAYVENSTTPPPPPPTATATCQGLDANVVGTDSDETLRGTSGPDVIAALGGNDKVKGGLGEDLICGGPGKDKLSGAAGNDKLFGEAGRDRLSGGGSKGDICNGGPSKDKAFGSCETKQSL